MSNKLEAMEINEESVDIGRRKALSRLGLAASAAYAAPVLMTLSQSAHASGGDGGGGGSNSGGGDSDSGTSGLTSGTSGTSDGDTDAFLSDGDESNSTG